MSDPLMKAALARAYGGPEVIEIGEVPIPLVRANEVLVEVHATCVNSGDVRVRSLDADFATRLLLRAVFGLRRPRNPILGTDFAGVVQAIGSEVTRFKIGDHVFGSLGTRTGSHAEFVTISENEAIMTKPRGQSMTQSAASIFGGMTAIHFLKRLADVKRGERVLINGASGAVGSAAVQIAHSLGAKVTGVCSEHNLALVRSLGADRLIDYAKSGLSRDAESYDVILDTVGNLSWENAGHRLNDNGRLILLAAELTAMIGATLRPVRDGRRLITGVTANTLKNLRELRHLIEYQDFRPVIEKVMGFASIREAHRAVDTKSKRGSLVINMRPEV